MARGRMINQKIAEDIDFNEMSIDAQFLFMRAIPFLDRDGLIWGHPVLLLSKIAPLLPQYATKLDAIINEWVNVGFVIKYTDGKTPILFFKGFYKNQAMTHYERESPSIFPPPPGHYRTPKGLRPLSNDDGGSTENEPPTKPKDNPPSDKNKEKSDDQPSADELRTNSGLTPDEVLTNSSRERGMEVKVKEKGREDQAHEAKPIAQPPPPPSSKQPTASTGDPLMDAAANRFKQRQVDGHRKAARGGAWPELDKKVAAAVRLPLVERLIDMHGLRAAIDVAEDDYKLADMHRLAADLYVMGFTTVADIETVYAQFKKDWKGKTPAGRQLATIASNMKQQPGQSPPVKVVLPLGKWCLQKYGVDRPMFVPDVPENLIYEQYEQYKRQYQQAH